MWKNRYSGCRNEMKRSGDDRRSAIRTSGAAFWPTAALRSFLFLLELVIEAESIKVGQRLPTARSSNCSASAPTQLRWLKKVVGQAGVRGGTVLQWKGRWRCAQQTRHVRACSFTLRLCRLLLCISLLEYIAPNTLVCDGGHYIRREGGSVLSTKHISRNNSSTIIQNTKQNRTKRKGGWCCRSYIKMQITLKICIKNESHSSIYSLMMYLRHKIAEEKCDEVSIGKSLFPNTF